MLETGYYHDLTVACNTLCYMVRDTYTRMMALDTHTPNTLNSRRKKLPILTALSTFICSITFDCSINTKLGSQ
jgi:hypothetical protein